MLQLVFCDGRNDTCPEMDCSVREWVSDFAISMCKSNFSFRSTISSTSLVNMI